MTAQFHSKIEIRTMPRSISASVGLNGTNRRDDVLTVQQLLNAIDPAQGGANPKLDPDGWIGPLTIGAIKKFQQHHFGWADGRVDTDSVTIKKLNELADAPCPGKDAGRGTCRLPRPHTTIGPIEITPVPSAPPPPTDPLTLARQDAPTAIRWAQAAARSLERAVNQFIDA